MGLMSVLGGLGGLLRGAKDVSEVLVENKTERAAQEHLEFQAALEQLGKEFARERLGWFDALIDGLNRLPRPAMALGTMGLFGYSMLEPEAFAARMQGLALVPDPLWWLLGAVVSFYFGAREMHYFRAKGGAMDPERVRLVIAGIRELDGRKPPEKAAKPNVRAPQTQASDRFSDNPALAEWLAQQ